MCAGPPKEQVKHRHSMKDPTVHGVGHLIETKTFGPKGSRKRLVLEQPKG